MLYTFDTNKKKIERKKNWTQKINRKKMSACVVHFYLSCLINTIHVPNPFRLKNVNVRLKKSVYMEMIKKKRILVDLQNDIHLQQTMKNKMFIWHWSKIKNLLKLSWDTMLNDCNLSDWFIMNPFSKVAYEAGRYACFYVLGKGSIVENLNPFRKEF